MQHKNAVVLLHSLRNMLEAFQDERRRRGAVFDASRWIGVADLADSEAFTDACNRLDDRPEDRALERELFALLSAVVPLVHVEKPDEDTSEHVKKQLREACPLFSDEAIDIEAKSMTRKS